MKKPSMFFKVFLVPICSQKLDIPLTFVSLIRGALPNQAVLRNRNRKLWLVTIAKIGNVFSFSDGWAKFVEDNFVEHDEFLVFIYDGDHNVFDVTIYGHDCCSKEMEIEDESDEENNDETNVYMGNNISIEEMNDTYVNEGLYQKVSEEKELDEEKVAGYEESEDDEGSDEENDEYRVDESDATYEESKEYDEEGDENDVEPNKKGKRVKSAKGLGKKKKKTSAESSDDDEDEVFRSGIIARPKNPFFVSKLRPKRKNELYIPLYVIRDHRLEIPEKMIILDEKNREWDSDVKVWGDGRTWLTNGFKAFKKWNVLKKQDRCICEFVKHSDPRGLFLKIRILREGSW